MADPLPSVDLASLAAGGGDPGARWWLDGEDLQANLVWLGRGDRIQPHRNDEVEVLVVVVLGRGKLTLAGRRAYRWVGLPSHAEGPRGKPPGRSARLLIRPLELWARCQVVQDPAPKDGEADDPGLGRGDLEDMRVHDLAGAATRLLERAAAALAGRVALTLVAGADPGRGRGRFAQATLLALRGGV